MNTLFEDLQIGWRMLWRAPGYSLVATLVLALGVGATTVIYGVLKGVVLNPLPFAEQHELVRIRESKLPVFPEFAVAPGNFVSWRAEARAFESMTLYAGASYNMTGRAEPARLRGVTATPEFFATLGVTAALGRTFGVGDAAGDGQPVVLGHGAWMTHFGGDPQVVGQAVTLNDKSYTVVGVLPPKVYMPSPLVDVYTVWRLTPEEEQIHGGHYTSAIGRLAPGATLEQAHAELDTVAQRLEREFPDSNTGWRTLAVPLADDLLGDARDRLYLLLGGVALVLLIACANVASLTLVRATGRAHEFAIRRAQGATGWRVARQLVTEGTLLAAVGGALGVALAALALPAVRGAAPEGLPRVDEIALDPAVLVVAALVSLLAGVAASVVPAALATRRAVAADLRDGGRGATGMRGTRTRSALIVAEVALAVVLLAGAGVLGRSLASLAAVDPGFATESNAYTRLALPGSRYQDDPAAGRFYAGLVERIGALPGVRAAGVVQSMPMVSDYVLSFEFDGRPAPKPGEEPNTNYYSVSPGYLGAMDIPLQRGRALSDADREGAPLVALVSESFVAKYYPGEEPLGKRIRFGGENDPWIEIVGVVGDVKQYGLDARLLPQAYVPFAQAPFHSAFVVIDTELDAAALAGPVREAVRAIDPDQPVGQVQSVADMVNGTLAARRFSTFLLGLFALTALALAVIGLYGTIAYSVSQATRDLGVRMALGAARGHVLGLVVGQGMRLTAVGAVLGVVGALAGGTLIEGFVFDVSPRDPATLAAIVAVMLAAALAASLLPAWRATRIDPMVALRHE